MLYDRVEPEVRAVIDEFENTALAEQGAIDAEALKILGENPTEESISATRDFLTGYSLGKAQDLFDTWKELDIYLLVKYMDGNIKKETGYGKFKSNGHSPRIPAFPDQPGYSDKWKEVVAKDAGDVLEVK